jgi:seryl-tRNA synthetase
MLDIKVIKNNPDAIIKELDKRGTDHSYLKETIKADDRRIDIIKEVEELKAFRNSKSKEIGIAKREGKSVDSIMAEVSTVGDKIDTLDDELSKIHTQIKSDLLKTPNVPRETVPVGADEDDNVELEKFGNVTEFNFTPLPH